MERHKVTKKTNIPFQFVDKDDEKEKHISKKLVEVHSHIQINVQRLWYIYKEKQRMGKKMITLSDMPLMIVKELHIYFSRELKDLHSNK